MMSFMIDGSPTVVPFDDQLQVGVHAPDGHLYHRWGNGIAWSGWEDLGGTFTLALPSTCAWSRACPGG